MKISAAFKSTQTLRHRASLIQKHSGMASVLKIEGGAWHGLIDPNGQFPAEKGRYHLYIGK
jgi:glutathionyl-hydroquinone reductase